MGIFTILHHTPVKALGINRDFHFAMPSLDEWHGIGNMLAPKELWSGFLKNPGLRSMLIEGYRAEANDSVLRVKIEPSIVVVPGVFISVNEEFKSPSTTGS